MAVVPETVKYLTDLAIKRHEAGEKTVDVLNTRLAALFAFNSFIIPSGTNAIHAALKDKSPFGMPKMLLLILWCLPLVGGAVACVLGYLAGRTPTLPNPAKVYGEFASQNLEVVGAQIIANLEASWGNLKGIATFKGTCLNTGLLFLLLEFCVLVFAFLGTQ